MMQEYDYEFAEFVYYTPGGIDREGRLWPVRAGRSKAKPNYNVGPKRIECYSLHFIHEGKVRISYGGNRQVELQKDDLFCLFPGVTYHYEQIAASQPLRMNWLALDGDRAGQLLELAGLTPERPYGRKLASPAVRQSADRAIQTMMDTQRWNAAAALELQGLICKLFAELLSDSAAAVHEAASAGWIEECKDYMELHATEGITVQQVAAFAGLHRSYFTQAFASQVGMPPMKYIQKIRMDKAMRLLTETNASITEIALSLGYPSLYAFTRAFKVYYRASPLAMRATQ